MRTTDEPGSPDFAAFVAQRSAALFRSAYVLTGSQDSAQELLQEALVRACGRWRRVSEADSPEAYVHRIMINLANDRWRRWRRTAPVQDLADRPVPGDEYGRVDTRDQIIRALHRLPMGMRTVIVLHYFHDMSDTQIAATMGISPGTARSQLARGLRKLRDQLPQRPLHPARQQRAPEQRTPQQRAHQAVQAAHEHLGGRR